MCYDFRMAIMRIVATNTLANKLNKNYKFNVLAFHKVTNYRELI